MIPIYYIEDLTLDMIDELVERGVVFDVTSKTSVLPKSAGNYARNPIWSSGDKRVENLQHTDTGKGNTSS